MARKCTTCNGDKVITGGERGETMEACPSCSKPKSSKSKPRGGKTPAPRKSRETAPPTTPAEPKVPKPLTIKQEKFCQEYVKTGNASEAYRRAYNAGNMTPKSVNEVACQLMSDLKISSRVSELKAKAAERHDITVDSLTEMLIEDRKDAKLSDQHSVAVAAVRELGRLHGLIIDRKEITVHGAISAMSDDELSSFIEEVDVDDDDYAPDEEIDD